MSSLGASSLVHSTCSHPLHSSLPELAGGCKRCPDSHTMPTPYSSGMSITRFFLFLFLLTSPLFHRPIQPPSPSPTSTYMKIAAIELPAHLRTQSVCLPSHIRPAHTLSSLPSEHAAPTPCMGCTMPVPTNPLHASCGLWTWSQHVNHFGACSYTFFLHCSAYRTIALVRVS